MSTSSFFRRNTTAEESLPEILWLNEEEEGAQMKKSKKGEKTTLRIR